jgi:hypothetical protein
MMIALFVAAAWALAPYDPVELGLAGGTTLEGVYLGPVSPSALSLVLDGRTVTVELALVETVTVAGATETPEGFALAVADAWARRSVPFEGPTPLPGVALGASLLFSGSGHALLREGRTFRGYAVLETVFLGTEAFALLYDQNVGLFLSVAAVDVLFRGLSAADAHRIARRRRGHRE